MTLTAQTTTDTTDNDDEGCYLSSDLNTPLAVGDSVTTNLEVVLPANTQPGGDSGEAKLFDKVTFKKAGTYEFTIKEVNSGDPGVEYSNYLSVLTVTVTDSASGKLTVTKVVPVAKAPQDEKPVGSAPTFDTEDGTYVVTVKHTNKYVPEPTEFTPKTTKTIKVEFGPTVAEKIFKFDLKLESAVAKDGTTDVTDGADIKAETKTITVAAGETVDDVLFSKITFTKAGTYTYSITEQPSGEEGITDDTSTKTLVIEVTDKDGALYIAKYTYSTGETHSAGPDDTPLTGLEDDLVGNEVENIYTPNPTTFIPKVTKKLTTEFGPIVAEKEFEFNLVFKSATAPWATGGTTGDDGTTGDAGGTTGDAKAGTGGTTDENKPKDPAETMQVDGKPYEDSVTVTIPVNGTTKTESFKEITFTMAGTYVFEITEKVPPEVAELPGITEYSDAVWTLTIEIRDTDNQLVVASYKYEDESGRVTDESTALFDSHGKLVQAVKDAVIGAEFTNVYVPKPTEFTPEVSKVIDLVTDVPTSEDKTFNFDLVFVSGQDKRIDENGNEIIVDVSGAQLETPEAADGSGTTGETGETGGTTEETGGTTADTGAKNGESGDTSGETGGTTGESGGTTAAAQAAQFKSSEVELVVPAGETDAGPVPFDTITFTQSGTYIYEVTERAGSEVGMEYDAAHWILTIVVTDHDGELKVDSYSYTLKDGEEQLQELIFNNPYTTGDLIVKKTVRGGGASQTKLFNFTLTLRYNNKSLKGEYPLYIDGEEVGTVKNGSAKFKLRHDQTALVTGIPCGATWTVVESVDVNSGYRVIYTNQNGTIGKGINSVLVVNHRDPKSKIPKTGYGTLTGDIVGAGTSALAFALGAVLRGKSRKVATRKKKTDEDDD